MKKLVIFGQSYKARGLARQLVGYRVERAFVRALERARLKALQEAKGVKAGKGQDEPR